MGWMIGNWRQEQAQVNSPEPGLAGEDKVVEVVPNLVAHQNPAATEKVH